jgi:hypothetical protein
MLDRAISIPKTFLGAGPAARHNLLLKAYISSMAKDPVETNPANYRVAFENERVRVLECTDSPGHATTEHSHPDSVMITLSAFRRFQRKVRRR